MIKKYKEKFNLVIEVGKSMSSPPTGPVLGQRGINTVDLSKEFNNLTRDIKEKTPISTTITLNKNRSIELNIRGVVSSHVLKQLAQKSTRTIGMKQNSVSTVSIEQLYCELCLLNANNIHNLQELYKMYLGTAASMGLIAEATLATRSGG